jgi:hypothetical protein
MAKVENQDSEEIPQVESRVFFKEHMEQKEPVVESNNEGE